MEMKQIRMGIVGAGTWGETHASIYAEHLFADPVAICDMNEERARAIADKYGIRKVYTDYHDLAADEEVDAVAIVTPDFAHADIAVAMADAKKNILIEKPLATTKEDIATRCAAWWICTTAGTRRLTRQSRRSPPASWERRIPLISVTAT